VVGNPLAWANPAKANGNKFWRGNMDVDLKNLSPKQEEALRQILAHCRYLNGVMKYEPSETVLRSVAQDLSRHYSDLVK
jgi:hypothetical protein